MSLVKAIRGISNRSGLGIRGKLVLLVLCTTMVVTLAAVLTGYYMGSRILFRIMIKNNVDVSRTFASAVSQAIDDLVEENNTLSSGPAILEQVMLSDRKYEGMTPEEQRRYKIGRAHV